MHIEQIFNDYLVKHNLSQKRVLVALSGGKDSMSLLHLCIKNSLQTFAVHCNFNLRGQESIDDETFVKAYCNNHQVSLYTHTFDTQLYANANKLAIQEAARQLRYNWFKTLLVDYNLDAIFTAHHADDLSETFLFHAVRGSGLKGLTSIPEVNNLVHRPLLRASSEQIVKYINQHAIPFRNDSSNSKETYTRNYIRHSIMPLLSNVHPHAKQNLTQTILNLKNEFDLLQFLIQEYSQHVIKNINGNVQINLKAIQPISQAKLLLFYLLKPFDVNMDMINEIIAVNDNEAKYWLTKKHKLSCFKSTLTIASIEANNEVKEVVLAEKIEQHFIWQGTTYTAQIGVGLPDKYEESCFYISMNTDLFPLTIRTWQEGDKFIPLGMTNAKKLSDFFIDLKLSPAQKKEVAVIESNSKIVAVLPHRISNTVKLKHSTTGYLIIKKEA